MNSKKTVWIISIIFTSFMALCGAVSWMFTGLFLYRPTPSVLNTIGVFAGFSLILVALASLILSSILHYYERDTLAIGVAWLPLINVCLLIIGAFAS